MAALKRRLCPITFYGLLATLVPVMNHPEPPSMNESFLPRIQSIFYAVFDPIKGPYIVCQVPEDGITVHQPHPASGVLSPTLNPVTSRSPSGSPFKTPPHLPLTLPTETPSPAHIPPAQPQAQPQPQPLPPRRFSIQFSISSRTQQQFPRF
ncbi:hypothetical protein OPQ81_011628 [Rhizoctonia solani]|nr:hypothetical protein OPQ81_011628 [Rhizoctonia solani]